MSKKAGKIALGLGLITGAVTGLLFAPEEGKKIRDKISKGDTKGLLDDLHNMGEEIKDLVVDISKQPHVVDAVDKAKDKAADVANLKREELDKMLKVANKKADKFKKTVAKYVKEQKTLLDEKTKPKKKKTTKKRKATKKKAAPKKTTKKATKKATAKKAPAKKKTTKKTTKKKSQKESPHL